MSNVKAVVPATPMQDEYRWRCQVCGREMAYSQPISLELSALLVGTFSKYHAEHCAPAAGEEVSGV